MLGNEKKCVALVKRTRRIHEMQQLLGPEGNIEKIMLLGHQVMCAHKLFKNYKFAKRCSIVFGHKNQGKSQFLFFLMRLLQELGEPVVLLDPSLPTDPNKDPAPIDNRRCIIHSWKDHLDTYLMSRQKKNAQEAKQAKKAQEALQQLVASGSLHHLNAFLLHLNILAETTRIWVLVDEVVAFQKKINLPSEQELKTRFHWIITGSRGISSFVDISHLKRVVWDLRIMSKKESLRFATNLAKALHISNWSENFIKPSTDDANVADFLEEYFGGIPGYIAECLMGIAEGNDVAIYLTSLYDRVAHIVDLCGETKVVSQQWLKNIATIQGDRWRNVRDAGLCGSGPPRGILFANLLVYLHLHAADHTGDNLEELLTRVTRFRRRFKDDPGLHGCLLELEMILRLKMNTTLKARKLTKLSNGNWIHSADTTCLPSPGLKIDVFIYDGKVLEGKVLENTDNERRSVSGNTTTSSFNWYLVQLYAGFPVGDVILVCCDNHRKDIFIYVIQITRSNDPFRAHWTTETCSDECKIKLQKLYTAIQSTFRSSSYRVHVVYVMYAPRCKDKKLTSAHNQTEYCYFSPCEVFENYDEKHCVKRSRGSSDVIIRSRKRRKPNELRACCRCKSGNCASCRCKGKCKALCRSAKCLTKLRSPN